MDSQNKTFNKYIIIEEKIFNKLSLKIKKNNIKNKYVYIYYNRYLRIFIVDKEIDYQQKIRKSFRDFKSIYSQ